MTDQFDENRDVVSEEPVEQVTDSTDDAASQYVAENGNEAYAAEQVSTPHYTADEELEPLPDSNKVTVPSRIEALTTAIELHPDAPVNYVFRGEALLDEGHYAEAAADFERGLALADSLAESANWGYIYRGLADRAREGLRRCS